MAVKSNKSRHRASVDGVRQILGDLDADVVSAILATGVTTDELVQAREWMDADAIIRAQLRHGADGAVAAVCDILADEEADVATER